MSQPREALDAILRKHRRQLDQAVHAVQDELADHLAHQPRTDNDAYRSYVLGIHNNAYDLRDQINAFFTTWIREN